MVSTFLNIENQIFKFRQLFLFFTISCAKNASKWLFFAHKISKSEKFCLELKIWFSMFRKDETNVITSIFFNIVTSHAVYGCTASYILKRHIFEKSVIPNFDLYSHRRQQFVDQKVNMCWPKLSIWKYTISAIYIYFYSFQNPSGGSEMIVTVKKVLKITKPMKLPYWPYLIARYRAVNWSQ